MVVRPAMSSSSSGSSGPPATEEAHEAMSGEGALRLALCGVRDAASESRFSLPSSSSVASSWQMPSSVLALESDELPPPAPLASSVLALLPKLSAPPLSCTSAVILFCLRRVREENCLLP